MTTEHKPLLSLINQEEEDFKTKQIQVVPGLGYNQYDLINKIIFYWNSKFTTGDTDADGDKKYFYNIVKNPCKVFSKAIDFDTKNIRLLTVEGGDSLKTWFMERDLKFWMRDKQFGKILNRIFKELPIYGSVVLKVVKGTPYFVDLRNFIVQQSADTLEDSNYLIEVHNYTPTSFRRAAKEMGWEDKIDEVLKLFNDMRDTSHIRVFERYGEVEEDGKYSFRRVFIADVGVDEYDAVQRTTLKHNGVVLSNEEWDDLPYWEFHADKIPGRWLGVGVVETLIEPQVRENELCNLQSKTSYWAALRVFQTRDGAVNRNMLTDIKNGEILNVDSEITQVDMNDRNLAFFNEEHQKWMRNRDEMTFSYDAVQGERAPASTPLGETRINTAQTLSYFEQIQENVAMDVKEMLYEVILPEFEKENSKEHTLRLVGQDLDAYIAMVKNTMVMQELIRQISNTGRFPTIEDRDVISVAIEESIKQEKEKILTVPRGFYKDLKYDIDIDITGESVDTRVRYATKFAILQAITADPTMTTDPVKKKILFSMAEDGGINPNDLFGAEQKSEEEIMMQQAATGGRAGGGVSAPDMTPVRGQMSQTV